MLVTTLDMLVKAVTAGLTGWKQIKAAMQGGQLSVQSTDPSGHLMTLQELEPHILAAEDARDAASRHAADRIDTRHAGDT